MLILQNRIFGYFKTKGTLQTRLAPLQFKTESIRAGLPHRRGISRKNWFVTKQKCSFFFFKVLILDEVSSISGSDSEKEDSSLMAARGKFFFEINSKLVFSLYKCLIFNKKEEITHVILRERLEILAESNKWCVLMLGGGHFAGAIFEKDVPILHKTFHCYTVRAGQGGAQSGRDNKSGGSGQPKSAGASLRRYNEQSLVQVKTNELLHKLAWHTLLFFNNGHF